MAGDPGKRAVRSFLEAHGFSVEEIPEAPNVRYVRRADLRAAHGTEEYLLEVKTRIGEETYLSTLYRSGAAEREQPLGRTNAVTARIRDGAEQVLATPGARNAFRLVVLVAMGDDPETQASQFRSTLYGTVDVVTANENASVIGTPCFFFSFSEFFRLPHIAGSLILIPGGRQLCVNTFSDRAPELRASRLGCLFTTNGGLVDPRSLEAASQAFIADCSLDRRDEEAILQYVRGKYALKTARTFQPKKSTASMLVRRNENGQH